MADAAENRPGAAALTSIQARDLYKDYGRHRALSGVSLRLRAGQVTALLGENGAGKSTLLAILAGLLRPTRGDVRVDDQPLADIDAEAFRRQLGVLSHEPRCYAELSPRENLRLFARLYELGAAERADAHLDGWLARVGLDRAADRPARTMSRGMLQRLAIARTLLHAPAFVLLDEPYTGLDQAGVALLSQLITAERARGALILVITHDLATVAPLCDQVVVLARGRVGACVDVPFGTGTADTLLGAYRDADRAVLSQRRGRGRAAPSDAAGRAAADGAGDAP